MLEMSGRTHRDGDLAFEAVHLRRKFGETLAPDRISRTVPRGSVFVGHDYLCTAPRGVLLSHFTACYMPPDPAALFAACDHPWINECVAVGDRILMLFEANSDEVFVVDRMQPADSQPSRTLLIT